MIKTTPSSCARSQVSLDVRFPPSNMSWRLWLNWRWVRVYYVLSTTVSVWSTSRGSRSHGPRNTDYWNHRSGSKSFYQDHEYGIIEYGMKFSSDPLYWAPAHRQDAKSIAKNINYISFNFHVTASFVFSGKWRDNSLAITVNWRWPLPWMLGYRRRIMSIGTRQSWTNGMIYSNHHTCRKCPSHQLHKKIIFRLYFTFSQRITYFWNSSILLNIHSPLIINRDS